MSTNDLNGAYHALLKDIYNNCNQISFHDWADDSENKCLTFIKDVDFDCISAPKGTPFELDRSLKTIFVRMDVGYGKSVPAQMKISTEELRNFHKKRHIAFIREIANRNCIKTKG